MAFRQRSFKRAAAFRIALIQRLGKGHAVGAEIAEALAQLAPGRKDAAFVPVAQQHGPDHALTLLAIAVAVPQRHLPAFQNSLPQHGRIDLVF